MTPEEKIKYLEDKVFQLREDIKRLYKIAFVNRLSIRQVTPLRII
jgi:hypothetical protein